MRLGRRLSLPAVAVVVGVSPLLAGCGLFDRGSTLDDAFEYLPADSFEVRFTDGDAAEELGTSELGRYRELMADAAFDVDDVEWEAWAAWGDPAEPDGTAAVWKVDDEADLGALADDLAEHGYEERSEDGRSFFSIDLSESEDGTIGGDYPVPLLLNVLIDEDEQVVAGATEGGSLEDVAGVIGDEDDSLADEDAFDDLVEAPDDDPDVAWLATGETSVCVGGGRPLPEELRGAYAELGRPEARALFVSGEEDVRLALLYESEDAAKDDLEARQALVDDGVDAQTARPFDELGDFDLEQDGKLVLIDEKFDGGAQQAVKAEANGGGPGVCVSPA